MTSSEVFGKSHQTIKLRSLLGYFLILSIKFHYNISVFGFCIILVFVSQLISGTMLAFSLVPECMLIPVVRDEEDLENLYTDDFFWLHERGVDAIFILSYIHLFRKFYLLNIYLEHESAWKSGTFTLMLIQIVTFLGLVLCCTHLSDITLKIASNTLHNFFMLKTKVYWWLFTDKNLNTDTVIRLAYAHYVVAFVLFFVAFLHAIDMHYDWKNDFNFDGLENELQWWNEVVLNELLAFIDMCVILFCVCLYLYTEPEALSYEIFMWGDVGVVTEPKFNQVAPHWYFRPLMAFLLVIPHAIIGVLGLIFFFFLLYHQVTLAKYSNLGHYKVKTINFTKSNLFLLKYNTIKTNVDFSLLHQITFYLFLLSCLYTTTFLPNGKYYQLLGGNKGMLLAYLYILLYLTYPNYKYMPFFNYFINKFKFKMFAFKNN